MSSSTFYNGTNLVGVGSVAVGGFIPIAGGPTLGVIGNVYASTGFWGAGNNISNVQISTSFSGLNPGGVIYAQTVNAILSSAAGTSGQIFVSGGASAPTWTSYISPTLIYANTLSNISGSNVTTGINASNITTGILSSSYIYGNTLWNINASNIVGFSQVSGNTLSNINASNLAFGIVSSSLIYGNTLSNLCYSNLAYGTFSTTGTISYSEDIVKRGPYLTPSSGNGGVIQAWISATCNASSQPTRSWWATSQTPSYANTAVFPLSNSAYSGSVLLPDNRVLFVPANSSSACIYNPDNPTQVIGYNISAAPGNFAGGLLLPTGNVLFCPQTSNVGMYNPLSSIYSNSTALPGGGYSGTLTANNVIFAPQGTPSNVINYNFTSGAISNVLALPSANIYGKSWTTTGSNLPASTYWRSVAWSPQLGIFVAVAIYSGSYGAAYSPDGKTWVTSGVNLPVNEGWISVAWSPQLGIFVAVNFSSAFYGAAYSADGKTWVWSGVNLPLSNWYSVAWSPQLGIFVAVNFGSAPGAAYSADGKTWVWSGVILPVSTNWSSVAWSPQLGIFVAVANGSGSYGAAYSPDGKTWVTSGVNLPFPTNWTSVAWSPQLGIFVAVAFNGGSAAYSADGKTWVTSGVKLPGSANWNSVAWSPQLGIFVAVAFNSGSYGAAYSADGKTWVTSGVSSSWYSVAWSPQLGIFVEVGSGSYGSTCTFGPGLQQGACLLTNGNVIVPYPGTANVIQFNPVTLAASNLIVGTDGFNGLTLTPNGNVIGTPMNSNIIVINPSNFTSSNLNIPSSNANTQTFYGGACLSATGNIIFAPSLTITANVGTSNVGMYDPVAGSFSNSTPTGSGFSGATLHPSGQIVFSPTAGGTTVGVLSTMVPAPPEFCRSPYFNRT